MEVSGIDSEKKWLASFLLFQFSSCAYLLKFHSSRSVNNGFDMNTRALYSMRACGQGYAGFGKLASLMNLPRPMTSNNFDGIFRKLIIIKAVAEKSNTERMQWSKRDDDGIIDSATTIPDKIYGIQRNCKIRQ